MRCIPVLLAATLFCSSVLADNGLVQVQSAHDVGATADRLEKALQAKGMKIFARIDHAAGAATVDKELGPTELLIFGNPKVGTPLMQCARSAGIDLPQKALIWQDAQGTTWLSYNHPQYLKARHGIEGCDPVLDRIGQALGNFAAAATGR